MLDTVFEKQTCTRCGGSGRYSFNLKDRDTCYGCNGKGEQFTARGLAAAKFLTASLKVPAEQIKVGDVIRFEFHDISFWAPVSEVQNGSDAKYRKPDGSWVDCSTFTLWCVRKGRRYGFGANTQDGVRISHDAASKQAKVTAALEYQATLTKAGKPSKRRVKA